MSKTMNRPGFAVTPLVLIIVAVLAVGIVAYVAFVQSNDTDYTNVTTLTTNTYSNTNSSTNTVNANYAVNTNSSTAGWQTYTNDQFNFSLRYPEPWEVTTLPGSNSFFVDRPDLGGPSEFFGTIKIEDISLESLQSDLRSTCNPAVSISATQASQWNGNNDQEFIVSSCDGRGEQVKYIFMRHNNLSYTIWLIDDREEFQQLYSIMETFQFTN